MEPTAVKWACEISSLSAAEGRYDPVVADRGVRVMSDARSD